MKLREAIDFSNIKERMNKLKIRKNPEIEKQQNNKTNTITIHNMRNERLTIPYDVKVDRSSVFGNPFLMKTESQRDEVCDKYEKYFREKIGDERFNKEFNRLKKLLKEYGKLRLFCWCFPKRCHAETIRNYLK
jgi:hypothetical protein